MAEPCYITTAIDYPVGRPHLGNAFEKIGADVQARYRRMQGCDTRLLLGSDEHTVLVPRYAARAGAPAGAFVEQRAAEMRAAWSGLGISFDHFVRTSDPQHARGCRHFLQRLHDAGILARTWHVGLYCEHCEEYQAASRLRDGYCEHHPNVRAIEVRGDHYVFPLSAFRDRLLERYRSRPDLIQPDDVRAEIEEQVGRGLDDVAVTRQHLDWGIRAPFDPGQTIYVWVDALLSYLTAVGYATDEPAFRRWWPADVQVIGRDIAWFHCVLWPALLMAGGVELPRRVQVHGLMLHRGEKMSKTTGNLVDALDLAERFGADAVRFFLMRTCPFRGDGEFSHDRFLAVYRSDLVGKLGDLFDTTVSLRPGRAAARLMRLTPATHGEVWGATGLHELVRELHVHIPQYEYDLALTKIFERVIDPATRHLAAVRTQPRSKAARDCAAMGLTDALRTVAILLKPFMPAAAARIYGALRLRAGFDSLRLEDAATPLAAEQRAVPIEPSPVERAPLFPTAPG